MAIGYNDFWHDAWLGKSLPHLLLVLVLSPEGLPRGVHLSVGRVTDLRDIADGAINRPHMIRPSLLYIEVCRQLLVHAKDALLDVALVHLRRFLFIDYAIPIRRLVHAYLGT